MTYLGSSALFRFIHLPWPPLSFLLTLVCTAHPRPPCSPSFALLTLVRTAHPRPPCSPSSALLTLVPPAPRLPCSPSSPLPLVRPALTRPPCSHSSALLTLVHPSYVRNCHHSNTHSSLFTILDIICPSLALLILLSSPLPSTIFS